MSDDSDLRGAPGRDLKLISVPRELAPVLADVLAEVARQEALGRNDDYRGATYKAVVRETAPLIRAALRLNAEGGDA